MATIESTHISKKEFKMFCLEMFLGLFLWAVEKTPWSVSVCLVLMALVVIPIVRYSEWVQKKKISKGLAFILWYVLIGVIGWHVWPREKPHGEMARRVEELRVEPFFPYHPGIAKMNVFYNNAGEIEVRNARFAGRIDLTPVSTTEDELFGEFKSKVSFSPVENEFPPHSREFFKTIFSRALTEGDVNLLVGSTPMMKMCAESAILWEDVSGQYESDLCACVLPQKHAGAMPPFAYCAGHNGELKTR